MAIDEGLHKRMVKMVLGNVAKIEDDEIEKSVLDSVKESAKPKIRGLKNFFLAGINEMKRDIKKTQKKTER
jgi:hypothetical protein